MRNVHERLIPAPVEEVWQTILELGSPSDRIFPPTHWGPFYAPDGLTPGATVYHGATFFRYPVVEVVENEKVWFHLPALGAEQG